MQKLTRTYSSDSLQLKHSLLFSVCLISLAQLINIKLTIYAKLSSHLLANQEREQK